LAVKPILSSHLTPRGAALLGGALALVIIGLVFINGILITLGVSGLMVLVTAALAGRANLRQLDVEMAAPACAFAGAIFPLTLTLRNHRGLLDAFGVQVEVNLPGETKLASYAGWIPAGSAADLRLRTSILKRGASSEHFCVLNSLAPLGLLRVSAGFRSRHDFLIFPRPIMPVEMQQAGNLHEARPVSGASPGDSPGTPRGVRPYQSGDAAKRIHWPASARALVRGQSLMTRESDPPGAYPRSATVIFHSFGSDGQLIRVDRYERALSLAIGTLRHLHALGMPAKFIADFNAWQEVSVTTRSQLASCNTLLALAKRPQATETHELQAAILSASDEHALIIISDIPPENWKSSLPPTAFPPILLHIRQHRGAARRTLGEDTAYILPHRRPKVAS